MTDNDKKDEDKPADGGTDSKPNVKIMHVQTRFTAMANRAGGMKKSEALDRAETFIENIGDKYLEWVEKDMEALNELYELISQTNNQEGFTEETYDLVYRKATHIRDLGSTFGYHLTTTVADSLCELIFRLGEGKNYSREAMDAHVNALRLVCTPRFKDVEPAAAKDLLDSLEKLVARFPDPDAELKEQARLEAEKRRKHKKPE